MNDSIKREQSEFACSADRENLQSFHKSSYLIVSQINLKSFGKYTHNSRIITIFANKICENRLHLGKKRVFCTRFALFLTSDLSDFRCYEYDRPDYMKKIINPWRNHEGV